MSLTTPATRQVALPPAAVLIGGFYAAGVLGSIAVFAGRIAFGDGDPHVNDGPVESLITVAVMGTAALVVSVGAGLLLVSSPARAKVGAIVFGSLAVVSVIIFWAAAPAIFGSTAAWLAGLTKGGRPLGGAARVMGLIGLFLAVTNILLLGIAYVAE